MPMGLGKGRAASFSDTLWGQPQVGASPPYLKSIPGCSFSLTVFLFILFSGWGTKITFLSSSQRCHISLLNPLLISLLPSSNYRTQRQHVRCMVMATMGSLAHGSFPPGPSKTLALTVKPLAWKVWAGWQWEVVLNFVSILTLQFLSSLHKAWGILYLLKNQFIFRT